MKSGNQKEKDYEEILSKIPYDVIERHLKRRKEEAEDYLRWAR